MLEVRDSNTWTNLMGLLQLVWRRKYIVASITAVVVFGALIYHVFSAPVFRSSSILMIEESDSGRSLYGNNQREADPGLNTKRLETDMALLKSFPLAERVVVDLYRSEYRDSLEIFGSRTYQTKIAAFFDGIFKRSDDKGLEHDLDTAKALAQNAGQDAKLDVEQGADTTQADLSKKIRQYAEKLQSKVAVENQEGTSIIRVSVASPFAEESALLTNALCDTYQQWNVQQATSLRDFIVVQLEEQEKKVDKVEGALSRYMRAQNIYDLTGSAGQLVSQLVDIDSQRNNTLAQANILKHRLDYLTQTLSGEEKVLSERVAQSLASKLNAFKAKIRKEEKALQDLALKTGNEDITVRNKRAEIDRMKTQLARKIRTQIAGELGYSARTRKYQFDLISEQLQTNLRLAELEYKANELLRLKRQYEAKLEKLPQKQLEYARLQRDREVMTNTYSFLRQRLEESRIDIASKTGEVAIVGEAFPLDSPVSPDLRKNLLIGLLAGLGLGVLLVYVQNVFDDTIRDEQFFEDNDLIVLAKIPFIGKLTRKSLSVSEKTPEIGQGTAAPMLITNQLSSAFAESFRDLRTNLGLFHDNSKLKSLLITGTSVSEGKSTVCANLALSMSMLGKKVIIVDCDLRRPAQQDFFSVSKSPGVSDFLSSESESLEGGIVQKTDFHNLFILAAGTEVSNPNELLYSSRVSKLIQGLKKEYDLVLLDSPPMLLLSDAALLSQSVDGVLLTGRTRYSSKKHFKELRKLVFLKENLLGVVLIGDTFQKKYGKYGYTYKQFDYYTPDKK